MSEENVKVTTVAMGPPTTLAEHQWKIWVGIADQQQQELETKASRLSAALARNKELETCVHLGRKLYFIGVAEGEAAQTGGYEAAKEEERLEQKAHEIANAMEEIVPHIVGFDVDVALAALNEQGPGGEEG